MGGELSPGDLGPCHRDERTTPAPAPARIRKLPPSGPRALLPRKRHSGKTRHRAEANSACQRGRDAAPRWFAPSLHVARSGVEALGVSSVAGRWRALMITRTAP